MDRGSQEHRLLVPATSTVVRSSAAIGHSEAGAQHNINGNNSVVPVTNNAGNELNANSQRPSPLQTIQEAISEMLRNIRNSSGDKNTAVVSGSKDANVSVMPTGMNMVTQTQKDGGNGNNNCGNSTETTSPQGGGKTTEKGCSNSGSGGKIKRPMNAFMVWAREYRCVLAKGFPDDSNSQISVRLGDIWSNLSNEEKKPFYDKADKLRRQHEKDYPDWVYQPNKKKRTNGSPPNQQQYFAPVPGQTGQSDSAANAKNVKILPKLYPQPQSGVPQVMMTPPNHMYMGGPNCQPGMRNSASMPGPNTPRPTPQGQGLPHQPARPMYHANMAPQMPAMQQMAPMPTPSGPGYQYQMPYQHTGLPCIPAKENGPYYASPKRQARHSNMPEASPLAADKFQNLLTQHPLNDVIGKLSPDPKKVDISQPTKKMQARAKPKPKRTKKPSPRSSKPRKALPNRAGQGGPTAFVSPSWSYMGSPYGSIPTVMYSPYSTSAPNGQVRANSTPVMQNTPPFLQFSPPQTFVSPNQAGFVPAQNMAPPPMGSVFTPGVPMVSPYQSSNARPDYSLPPPPLMLPSQPGVMMFSPQPVRPAPTAQGTVRVNQAHGVQPAQFCNRNSRNINYNNNSTPNANDATSTGTKVEGNIVTNSQNIANLPGVRYSQRTQQNAPAMNGLKGVPDGSQVYGGNSSGMNGTRSVQQSDRQIHHLRENDFNSMTATSTSSQNMPTMNFYHSQELAGINSSGIGDTRSTMGQTPSGIVRGTVAPPNPAQHHHQVKPNQMRNPNPPQRNAIQAPITRGDDPSPMQTSASHMQKAIPTARPFQPNPVQNTLDPNSVPQSVPMNATPRESAGTQIDGYFSRATPAPTPLVGAQSASANTPSTPKEQQNPAVQGQVQSNIQVDLSQQEFILIGDTYYQVVRQSPSDDTAQNSVMINLQQKPGDAGSQVQAAASAGRLQDQNVIQGNADANPQQMQQVDQHKDQTGYAQNVSGSNDPEQHQHGPEQCLGNVNASQESPSHNAQSMPSHHDGREQSMSLGAGTPTGVGVSETAPLPRKKSFLQTLQAPLTTMEAADQLTRLIHPPAKPHVEPVPVQSPGVVGTTDDATHISPAEYIMTAMAESDIRPETEEQPPYLVVERSASSAVEQAFQNEIEAEKRYATLSQNQVFVLSEPEPVMGTSSVVNETCDHPTYTELSTVDSRRQSMFATPLERPHDGGSTLSSTEVPLNRSYSPDLTDKDGVPEKMFQTPPGSSAKSGSEDSTPQEEGQRPIDLSIVSADSDSLENSQREGKLPQGCSPYLIDLESKRILVKTEGWDVEKCEQVSRGQNLGDQKALVQLKRAHESLVRSREGNDI